METTPAPLTKETLSKSRSSKQDSQLAGSKADGGSSLAKSGKEEPVLESQVDYSIKKETEMTVKATE